MSENVVEVKNLIKTYEKGKVKAFIYMIKERKINLE